MEKQTWIHVGFPKCGSTSLQRDFFAKSNKICYIGRFDDWHGLRESHHKPLLALATLDESQYRIRKQEIEREIKCYLEQEDGIINIISDEVLVSSCRPYLNTIPAADSYMVAQRLKSIFPEAKILMVIRNQVMFLSSMMGQIIRNNRLIFDLDNFFTTHRSFAEQGLGSFLHMVDYQKIHQIYAELFGTENVEVILLEEIGGKPESVMDRLLRRMGLNDYISLKEVLPGRQNTRATKGELMGYKYPKIRSIASIFSPHFIRKAVVSLLSHIGWWEAEIKKQFSDEEMIFLDRFYATGNHYIQKTTGLDLSAYGYPLG